MNRRTFLSLLPAAACAPASLLASEPKSYSFAEGLRMAWESGEFLESYWYIKKQGGVTVFPYTRSVRMNSATESNVWSILILDSRTLQESAEDIERAFAGGERIICHSDWAKTSRLLCYRPDGRIAVVKSDPFWCETKQGPIVFDPRSLRCYPYSAKSLTA